MKPQNKTVWVKLVKLNTLLFFREGNKDRKQNERFEKRKGDNQVIIAISSLEMVLCNDYAHYRINFISKKIHQQYFDSYYWNLFLFCGSHNHNCQKIVYSFLI